jgi:hypothetical protein
MVLINYYFLAKAEEFYTTHGFNQIQAPWCVPPTIMDITRPKDSLPSNDYYLPKNKKCLVASAEQSFLYLSNQGLLLPGLYQATTPCFREEIQGPMKRKFFMKNELIIVDPEKLDPKYNLDWIIQVSLEFFKTVVPDSNLLQVVQTDIGYDIEYKGVEIGSYGERETSFVKWIYATGCAEPRLSWAITMAKEK